MNQDEKEFMEAIGLLEELEEMNREIASGQALQLRGVARGRFVQRLIFLEERVKVEFPDLKINRGGDFPRRETWNQKPKGKQ